MKHLEDGALRRLYDDPLAVSDAERAHFARCAECGERFDTVAADARRAAALLEVTPATVDVGPALATAKRPRQPVKVAFQRRLPWRPALAGGLAAAAIVAVAVTGAAQQLFTIAQPSQIAVVPVTTSELQAMPDLSQFGTVSWNGRPDLTTVADAAAAATAAGFAAPPAVTPPAGAPATPTYGVIAASTATFTFSAAKAQAWAAVHNVTLPVMPASMDGASLELNVGPAIVELFGTPGQQGLPELAVGKMRAPTLQSTGPSVKEIEDYLLSVPGFPAGLAAQLRAIGDPTTTLPLPVPVNRVTTQQVTINGVTGTAIGDDTGLGAGVIWVTHGFVYGVAGTVSQDQVTTIAESVH
ncbi:MAG TPA: hypothetical protein VF137_08765 [Candidatus Dormibacteraeota bacterium]